MEGIFRVSANYARIQEIKSNFEKGKFVDLEAQDPHTVAGLLKQILRELHISVIPEEFKSLFCRVEGNFIWFSGLLEVVTVV